MKIEMMKMIKESKVELLLRTMVTNVKTTRDKISSLQVQSSNGEKFDIEELLKLQAIFFIEHWGYQADVRQQLRRNCVAKGFNIRNNIKIVSINLKREVSVHFV